MSNNNSLKVLLAGAECAPFVKLGGLADVMGTLPKELNQIGADARVIMPFHSQMKGKYGAQTRHLADFNINFSGGETYVGVEELVYNENLIIQFSTADFQAFALVDLPLKLQYWLLLPLG